LQAIRRGKWELAGYIENDKQVIEDSNPFDKRIGLFPCREHGRKPPIYHSVPKMAVMWYDGERYTATRSVFYKKRFGMEDPWSLDRREMHGITPEGPVPEIIRNTLDIGEEG
jgi:hypothetical protein